MEAAVELMFLVRSRGTPELWAKATKAFLDLEDDSRNMAWVACLERLATRPPAIPRGAQISAAEWLSLCRHQVSFIHASLLRRSAPDAPPPQDVGATAHSVDVDAMAHSVDVLASTVERFSRDVQNALASAGATPGSDFQAASNAVRLERQRLDEAHASHARAVQQLEFLAQKLAEAHEIVRRREAQVAEARASLEQARTEDSDSLHTMGEVMLGILSKAEAELEDARKMHLAATRDVRMAELMVEHLEETVNGMESFVRNGEQTLGNVKRKTEDAQARMQEAESRLAEAMQHQADISQHSRNIYTELQEKIRELREMSTAMEANSATDQNKDIEMEAAKSRIRTLEIEVTRLQNLNSDAVSAQEEANQMVSQSHAAIERLEQLIQNTERESNAILKRVVESAKSARTSELEQKLAEAERRYRELEVQAGTEKEELEKHRANLLKRVEYETESYKRVQKDLDKLREENTRISNAFTKEFEDTTVAAFKELQKKNEMIEIMQEQDLERNAEIRELEKAMEAEKTRRSRQLRTAELLANKAKELRTKRREEDEEKTRRVEEERRASDARHQEIEHELLNNFTRVEHTARATEDALEKLDNMLAGIERLKADSEKAAKRLDDANAATRERELEEACNMRAAENATRQKEEEEHRQKEQEAARHKEAEERRQREEEELRLKERERMQEAARNMEKNLTERVAQKETESAEQVIAKTRDIERQVAERERKIRETKEAEQTRLLKEEVQRQITEEAARQTKIRAEERAKVDAEKATREETEKAAREEAERLVNEQAEQAAQAEAEKTKQEDAEKAAAEEAKRRSDNKRAVEKQQRIQAMSTLIREFEEYSTMISTDFKNFPTKKDTPTEIDVKSIQQNWILLTPMGDPTDDIYKTQAQQIPYMVNYFATRFQQMNPETCELRQLADKLKQPLVNLTPRPKSWLSYKGDDNQSTYIHPIAIKFLFMDCIESRPKSTQDEAETLTILKCRDMMMKSKTLSATVFLLLSEAAIDRRKSYLSAQNRNMLTGFKKNEKPYVQKTTNPYTPWTFNSTELENPQADAYDNLACRYINRNISGRMLQYGHLDNLTHFKGMITDDIDQDWDNDIHFKEEATGSASGHGRLALPST